MSWCVWCLAIGVFENIITSISNLIPAFHILLFRDTGRGPDQHSMIVHGVRYGTVPGIKVYG